MKKNNVFLVFTVCLLALLSVVLGFLPGDSSQPFDYWLSIISFTSLGTFICLVYLICSVEQESQESNEKKR